MVVKQELDKLNLHPLSVTMGEVELNEQLTAEQLKQLAERMNDLGFELLDDKKQKQIDKIKNPADQKSTNR